MSDLPSSVAPEPQLPDAGWRTPAPVDSAPPPPLPLPPPAWSLPQPASGGPPPPPPSPPITTTFEPPPGPPEQPPPRRRPTALRGAIEWVVIIAIALVGAFVIRALVVQTFFIPSDSMLPTLQKNDRVLVNKLSYRLHAVHRGDVVVFTHSPGFDPTINDLIKRVIGLPGETIQGQDGHVFINGHQLNEPYLPAGTPTSDFGPKVLAPNTYWVMGDNRTNSSDSRVFGAITKSQLVGRAFVLIWPIGRIGQL